MTTRPARARLIDGAAVRRRRGTARLLIAALAAGGTLAAATPAAGTVICVHRVSGACTETQPAVGTLGDQLQAAIDVTETNPGTDSILLGDGTYDRTHGFRYAFGDGTLVVQGTGASRVTLRNLDGSTSGTTFAGAVTSGIVVLRELTVVAPPAQSGVGVDLPTENSRVVEARVTGPSPAAGSPTGITGQGLSVEDVTVDGVYVGIFGSGSLLNVERTTVDARSDAVRSYAGTTTLRRVRARTAGSNSRAFLQDGGTATVENSVLDASATDPSANNQAVASVCSASASASTTLRFVTARSATAYGAYASCSQPGRTAALTVRDSILAPGTAVITSGAATVALSDSRWDGSGTGAIAPGPRLRTDPPRFVSATDLRLQPSSPLIDAATVAGSLLTEPYAGGDVLGGPRVLDGDGDGVTAPDLGAYEHAFVPVPPGGSPTEPGSGSPGGDAPDGAPGGGGDPGGGVPAGGGPGGGTPGDGIGTPGGGTTMPAYRGVAAGPGRVRLDRRRRARITVTCPASAVTRCRGTLALIRTTGKGRKRRTTTLGRATLAVRADRSVAVRIALPARTVRGITTRGLPVVARTRTRDARAGASDRTRTATVRLLPARR